MALLWFSFPPMGLWWLGWIAIVPLVWLIVRRDDPNLETVLPANGAAENRAARTKLRNRPYRQLYLSGLIYWLATFYFIPFPHPALWFGWFAVSAYMAIYTPLFVAVARAMVFQLKVPPTLAVAVTYTGIEWIRSHFATGMALVCLSHTQFKQPILIQVVDLCGGYTLTFVMSLFAAGLALAILPMAGHVLSQSKNRLELKDDLTEPIPKIRVPVVSIVSLALVLIYGYFRLSEPVEAKNGSTAEIALIQTSHDVIFRSMSMQEFDQQFADKRRLTLDARAKWSEVDLVVWPESAFNPYLDLLSDIDADYTASFFANKRTQKWSEVTGFPEVYQTPVPLLTGAGTSDPLNEANYASAILINKNGDVEERYFKRHLVMVGEYIPFIDYIPFLSGMEMVPRTTTGRSFKTMDINGVKVAPNICFESTVPHFIRRQINTLADSGAEPDVMINMTNDGWFFGTSCLDLHLACNVFRAVEMRKPHLICANTGFSGEIDTCGRTKQLGPRRAEAVLLAEIQPVNRTSLYRMIGDLIPAAFGWLVVGVAIFGWWNRKK